MKGTVERIMTREPASLEPSSTCGEAATLMKQQDCGSLPIVLDGRLVGIITDRDIVVRAVAAGKDPKTLRVSEIMTADPITIAPDASIDEATQLMAERQVRRLPVVADGRLVGIVVLAQLARSEDERLAGETLKEVSERPSGLGSHGRG
jgi:CBS domain-containing protein